MLVWKPWADELKNAKADRTLIYVHGIQHHHLTPNPIALTQQGQFHGY